MVAANEPRLRVTVAIDERSAGFWAVGYAKASGRAAVVLTTSGTAVANLFPAVIEASESLAPLIVLTADRPFEWRYTGANQTIDQQEIFGRYPRFFADIPAAVDSPGEMRRWRQLVANAVAAAANGPVHLNVAFREPLVPTADDGRDTAAAFVHVDPGDDERAAVTSEPAAGGSLVLEQRDLVVAGTGASRELVNEALSAAIPVLAEGHSNCRIPGTISTAHHLLSAGLSALEPSRLILLGRPGLSRPLQLLMGRTASVIVAPPGGDPARRRVAMVQVGSFVAGEIEQGWGELWLTADRAARRIIDRELSVSGPLTEPGIVHALWGSLPAGAVLSVGSSMPVRDLDWFVPPRADVSVISNRGASGIDGFLSLASGAAHARQPAYGLVGDLSFLHDINGLLTTPRPHLTVVLVNNRGGGIFSFLPQAAYPEHFERIFGTPAPVEIGALTESFGVGFTSVESLDDLRQAGARSPRGMQVIEAVTDRTENVAEHRRVTEAVIAGVKDLLALKASPPV